MDGILLINKEKNYTSHDVVAIVKKIFKEKVGHTGTLDPNATGVLPLLIGKGTKLSKYLINHDKEYEAVLKLGIKTDTLDADGNIIEQKNTKKLEIEKIQEVLKNMCGVQQQIPPMYSAIKINGKKLYQYARNNEKIEVQPRKIEIYNISLENYNAEEHEITFKISCSKGTYIRTVCEQIAKELDTIGYMKELNRIKVGEFLLEDAVTLDELKNNSSNENYLKEHMITFEDILSKYPKIELKQDDIVKFLNGVKLKYMLEDNIYRVYNKNELVGTGIISSHILKRDVIIF